MKKTKKQLTFDLDTKVAEKILLNDPPKIVHRSTKCGLMKVENMNMILGFQI